MTTEMHTPHQPTLDPAHATDESQGHTSSGTKKSWAVLAVAMTAQVLVVLDISVVNTALPTIGRSLHLDGGQLQWLVTAYLMMSGGGLLLGGRVADLLSRRKVFLTGLALFTGASLVSGSPATRPSSSPPASFRVSAPPSSRPPRCPW
jgi:MFS family permease